MSDSGDNKYKWSPESTTLLVSVWTDKQVQKQLEYSTKPQLIWESVARYMNKKGYNVNGRQCRTRMKQVLVCYREAKKAGTRAGVEQYYESIDRVLKFKKLEQINDDNGIDTVDSTAHIKSPPKDVKTNKNLQMRCKFQQPPESVFRTEALSPVWNRGRDEDYPDSPESNETVLAQPYRVLSPVRDAATNTTQHQLGNTNKKITLENGISEEIPIKESYRQNAYANNYFSEIPFQNTVQNVHNQIIQENMQQNQVLFQQNLLQNQLLEQNRLQRNSVFRQNIQNINNGFCTDQGPQFNQGQLGLGPNTLSENTQRLKNKYQFSSINNQAMPQEPRKGHFRQNLAATHRQFQDTGLQNCNMNMNQLGLLSPSISPDIPPNLNDAFCQSRNEKTPVLNETFTQTPTNADLTTITNNATFNDDSISIEFLQDSVLRDDEPMKSKDFTTNTDEIPHAPFRRKKAEKLERLMISAINSQTEVVNKILAAQNDMVTRVLDLDRDRQNRLENRLDHLLDVVQTAVLNKSSEKNFEVPPAPPEPLITNLMPPPKPGVIPPKLDLVPPKPCRVPCTSSNINCNAINQNPVMTKPGVVSPITSPSKKVGAIWQKLGPVSTSPFVRAQQQLGFRIAHATNNDVRTQSSAERRIAREVSGPMNSRSIIFETLNFLEAERYIQEEVENAKRKEAMGQELQARRRLFSQREPTAAMILTAAFLDAEIQSAEIAENARLNQLEVVERQIMEQRIRDHYKRDNNENRNEEVILAGQGENYERLKQLNAREKVIGDPCDSSTPAKPSAPLQRQNSIQTEEPRQTIQQLAQLVMNSARWRNNTANGPEKQREDLNFLVKNGSLQKLACSNTFPRNTENEVPKENHVQRGNKQAQEQIDGKVKTLEWLQDRYSYGGQTISEHNNVVAQAVVNRPPYIDSRIQKNSLPMTIGFTTEFLKNEEDNGDRKHSSNDNEKRVGFVDTKEIIDEKLRRDRLIRNENDPLEELQKLYLQKQFKLHQNQGLPFIMHNGRIVLAQSDMIERYMQEIYPRNKHNRESDSDNDEEFLDTTATMPCSRKNSLTTIGTKSGKTEAACIIS